MSNEIRDYPARSQDNLSRFLGGSPLAVAFRLILLSILVGVVLAAIGFDPYNILRSIELLFHRLWDLGFDAVNWLWRYFLLGAVIVMFELISPHPVSGTAQQTATTATPSRRVRLASQSTRHLRARS